MQANMTLSPRIERNVYQNCRKRSRLRSFGPFGFALTIALAVNGATALGQDWAHTWGGPGAESVSAVAVDPSSGAVYTTGSASTFGAGGGDVLLLKYDSSGVLLWSRTWGGPSSENGNGVAVDTFGNVYVVGSTSSFGAGWYDALILKFDSSGNLLWSRTWGGYSFDAAYDIAFDTGGNLYVAAEGYSNGNCAAVLKLSSTGTLLAAYSYKGPATYDSGYSIDVDKNGNVILAGISWDYSVYPNHNSILLVKFDNQGLDLSPKLRQTVKSQNTMNGNFDSWEFQDERLRAR